MMANKSDRRPESPPKPRPQASEQLPIWRNTRPRGNPEPDEQDLARSRERFEALLGR